MPMLFTWPRCLGLTLLFAIDAIRPGLAMNDPTRPSLPLRRGAVSQPATSPSPTAQAAASAVAAAEPRLQSLHLPQQGPATALVDGQLLRVGDMLGPNTITAIDAEGVSARGPAGRQRWTLLGVTYLEPAQARRAAARPGSGGPAALEPYIDTPPATAPAAAARWNGELPPVAPGLRRPAATPAPALPPGPQTSASPGAAAWGAAPAAPGAPAAQLAPATVAAAAPGAEAASRLAAWQPDPPSRPAPTESRSNTAAAMAWADLIATPQRMAQLVQRRLAADTDLARWQTLGALPRLASNRLPHAQGAFAHTAMQPLPVGPAVMRAAVTERPWQAATPGGRAAVAAAQQALMVLTLAQLHGPAATPALPGWPAPAQPAELPPPLLARMTPQTAPQTAPQRSHDTPRRDHRPGAPLPLDLATLPPTAAGPTPRTGDAALRALPAPTHSPPPSPPPRPAPQPALQLRMTLEPDPATDPPVSARAPAWVKESS
jgi:hypothetical protein